MGTKLKKRGKNKKIKKGSLSIELLYLVFLLILFYSIILGISINILTNNLRKTVEYTLQDNLLRYSLTFNYVGFFKYGSFDISLPQYLSKSQVDVVPRLQDIHLDNGLYIESLRSNILVIDLQEDLSRKITNGKKSHIREYTIVFPETKVKKNKNQNDYFYSIEYLITIFPSSTQ